ncbi:type VI secretion system-associated protein TagF [Methylobacter luteus]|uniref:type VI secretion system-associated protein TagF n=1 Tax=Methylobacter luteus TaxID=415 RepID=UPI0004140D31|nr:type VI secretion system-associated protein TagF [Methylobacter luteus]
MANRSIPGFYGKLPVLGDFISRRLSREFINPWDKWLQSAMAASQQQLGEHWLKAYLSSPVWRFALSPGLCGHTGWLGVLMPSVDRVGRYFPLTLALPAPPDINLSDLFITNNHWYAEAESIALTALEENLDLNGFDSLLNTLPSIRRPEIRTGDRTLQWNDDSAKKALCIDIDHAGPAEEALADLKTDLLDVFTSGYSLWATLGSEHIKPFLLGCDGLPPVSAFVGLLSGDMPPRGWQLDKTTLSSTVEAVDPDKTLPPRRINNHPGSRGSASGQGGPDPRWRSFARTDVGLRRKCNEDAVLDRPQAGLWAVADGMGGHQAGDVASRMIVEALSKLELSGDLETSIKKTDACLKQVNDDLRDLAESQFDKQIVGSTIVALIAGDQRFAYLWAGDSRLYRLRHRQLVQLTVDHCEDQTYPGNNPMPADRPLKQTNVITRALGADDDLALDRGTVDVQPGDIYLLSSDGLDKEVSFQEIETILNANDYEASVKALVDLTLERGARDNVSIVAIEIL